MRDDHYPIHRIELPIISLPIVERFANKYNILIDYSTPRYLDYCREISTEDVQLWQRDGYIHTLPPELENWLVGKDLFEKVDILCYEWYYE